MSFVVTPKYGVQIGFSKRMFRYLLRKSQIDPRIVSMLFQVWFKISSTKLQLGRMHPRRESTGAKNPAVCGAVRGSTG
jgi:hypothetical protein